MQNSLEITNGSALSRCNHSSMLDLDYYHTFTWFVVLLSSLILIYYRIHVFAYRNAKVDLFHNEEKQRGQKKPSDLKFAFEDGVARFVKENVPTLYGPQSGFRGAWWLPGCVII